MHTPPHICATILEGTSLLPPLEATALCFLPCSFAWVSPLCMSYLPFLNYSFLKSQLKCRNFLKASLLYSSLLNFHCCNHLFSVIYHVSHYHSYLNTQLVFPTSDKLMEVRDHIFFLFVIYHWVLHISDLQLFLMNDHKQKIMANNTLSIHKYEPF